MTDIARVLAPTGIARRELHAGWGWLLFTLGTCVNAMIAPIYKMIGSSVSTLDIVALRGVLIMIIIAIVLTVLFWGRSVRVISPWMHVLRGLLTFATWYGVVTVVSTLPLSLVQTLLYADALLAPIAFRVISKDPIERLVVGLTACGFGGVLIACVPSIFATESAGNALSWLIALGAAAALSLSFAIGRKISASAGGEDQLGPMLLTSSIVVAVLGCATAAIDMAWISNRPTPLDDAWWRAVGVDGFAWIVASGAASALAIWLLSAGANLGGSAATMFGLLGLPISYSITWVWFGEAPAFHVILGGFVITLSLAAQHARNRWTRRF